MDVATLITRSRQRAGLSQRALAERAGTSAAAICRYETGRRVPRVDTLTRIIAATGATLGLRAVPSPAAVDLAANGRTLEALLELADHLPHHSAPVIDGPAFASLTA